MIATFAYDENYDPALPIVELTIGGSNSADSIALTALVDSGADGTMIPLRYLRGLRARQIGRKRVRGISGIGYETDVYIVSIKIGSHQIGETAVVADRQNQQAILGRDILNQFVVTLNGLAHVVEISQ